MYFKFYYATDCIRTWYPTPVGRDLERLYIWYLTNYNNCSCKALFHSLEFIKNRNCHFLVKHDSWCLIKQKKSSPGLVYYLVGFEKKYVMCKTLTSLPLPQLHFDSSPYLFCSQLYIGIHPDLAFYAAPSPNSSPGFGIKEIFKAIQNWYKLNILYQLCNNTATVSKVKMMSLFLWKITTHCRYMITRWNNRRKWLILLNKS